MRSLGLIVPRESAERVRRALRDRQLLRTDLAVQRLGENVVFPVVPRTPPGEFDGALGEHEFDTVKPRPKSYRDLLPTLPIAETRLLPRSFDVVGDLVLIRMPDDLEDSAAAIGEALLRFVPGARRVGWDQGVHGVERRRRLVPIAGTGDWRTRHRENGVEIEVDLERAYFSPRLAREHERVARAVEAGDRVLDLCSGVGPFSLLIARLGRARSITAVDVNPDATALLRANAERLGVLDRIEIVQDDLARFLPRIEPAERVILNLPREGIKYLTSVATVVEGGGTLHYYEVTQRTDESGRSRALATLLGGTSEWEAAPPRVVHPYSPNADLVAFTLRRAAR